MEFLRFGSSIPGSYWGCCACCIIQNFKFDPDEKASIEVLNGDGGQPMGDRFCGPTYRDIFWQRLKIGTFHTEEMPNHAFLAILTDKQLHGTYGKAWLGILREAGFEFVRTVCNSVYEHKQKAPLSAAGGGSQNHVFGLFRNIGYGNVANPFVPPKEWTDLPAVTPEAWQGLSSAFVKDLAVAQHKSQTEVWDKIGPVRFLTAAEVVKAGAPVVKGGQRSRYPQQTLAQRQELQKEDRNMSAPSLPFAKATGCGG